MKAESVLNAVTSTGGELPKSEQVVLSAFIEDTKKLDTRMTNLENKVNQLDEKIDTVLTEQQKQQQTIQDTQKSVDQLLKLVEVSLGNEEKRQKVLNDVLNNRMFWIWLCLFTLLGFGASVADISSIFHIGG